MIQNALRTLGGIDGYGIFSLCLFITIFTLVLVWALAQKRTHLDRMAREGITAEELQKARNQLRARLVFENDSVTNLAHQLGYFETIASADLFLSIGDRIRQVTRDRVALVAARVLRPTNRTVGWFEPAPAEGGGDKGGGAAGQAAKACDERSVDTCPCLTGCAGYPTRVSLRP